MGAACRAPRARREARVATRSAQSFRCTFLRPDGSRFAGHVIGKPLRGEPLRFVALVRDLTEEESAREEVEAARRQVAQSEKLSALGSLVSGVAHEIRTPLTYLQTSLHLLERQVQRIEQGGWTPEAAGAARAQVGLTLEAAERITALVEDLRRFTRHKPGERSVTLAAAVRDGVALFEATHRGRAVVRAELAETPEVLVDALEAQQVVLNLLENAFDASPSGGVVRVRTQPLDDGALLEVEDDGSGMPPEVLARIYDPFFTTKPHGTGLGLSIVKRLAERAGASLACESAPGRGTRFALRFPASPR